MSRLIIPLDFDNVGDYWHAAHALRLFSIFFDFFGLFGGTIFLNRRSNALGLSSVSSSRAELMNRCD